MWRTIWLFVLATLLAACREPRDDAPVAAIATATLEPAASEPASSATATPASPPPRATAITASPVPSPLGVIGLFTDPRPRTPDRVRAVGEPPVSPFLPWDGVSTVIYDTVTRTETTLGAGFLGRFSPDSRRMLWTATPRGFGPSSEAWVIDLSTMERQRIGEGTTNAWVDSERLWFTPSGSNQTQIVDLRTGERIAADPRAIADVYGPTVLAEGRVLRLADVGGQPAPWLGRSYEVVNQRDGAVSLRFTALRVLVTAPGELVVATPPESDTTNVFIVNVASGQATFVATSRFTPPNWPLAATAGLIVWTEDYCGSPAGKLRIYDRRTGELTETDRSDWVQLTPAGLLATSPHGFGARALFDPRAWRYTVTIPALAPGVMTNSGSDVFWSSDYRYASHGFAGGHGGLC